jgi:hypothetical protein
LAEEANAAVAFAGFCVSVVHHSNENVAEVVQPQFVIEGVCLKNNEQKNCEFLILSVDPPSVVQYY